MKIIHLIWAFPIGGAETMLVEIMNIQSKSNKVVLIVINNLINEELLLQLNSNIKTIKINRPTSSKNYYFFLKTWLLILKEWPNTIHCHNANLSLLLKGLLFKSFLTIHSVDFQAKYLKKYDKVFAISKTVRKKIYDKTGLNATLVPNGININTIKVKSDYGFESFKLIQISRLEHLHKGQDILIKGINHLVNELNIKNIKVDFIGKGTSLKHLKELVSNYKLDSFIDFKGELNKNQINSMISQYDLLVQPSIFEGFGLTIVEGMVAKVPVLVSNVDGPIELIESGKYGSYFKSGDYLDCASKILEIMKNYDFYSNSDYLENIRSYAINNFNINKTAKKYLQEYNC